MTNTFHRSLISIDNGMCSDFMFGIMISIIGFRRIWVSRYIGIHTITLALPSLASHSHLFPPSLDTQSSSLPPPLPLLFPPPVTHNEQYCCQLEVSHTPLIMTGIYSLSL